ncbi:hypothetical protein M5K25_024246 [Dendrobium thyrsiflorum]|uniref:Uncharacterized protein n=1 Tax=Dendrobium thyrsiflorum TaxID=117978 RepID=A0ABD0U1S2_DENTH
MVDDETLSDLDLEDLENEIYKEDAMLVVREQSIPSTWHRHSELENEGDGDDIIGFNDLDAFGSVDFDEVRLGDSTYEDSFDDANLGDI